MTSLLGVLAALSLAATALAHRAARRELTRRRASRGDDPTPPVSILKPLRGVDDGLYENLAALAAQDYPVFEILCGAEDWDDPAIEVAHRVRRAFPHRRIVVRICDRPIGLNPKVNVLAGLEPHAQHELLLISDSNVRPGPDYLRGMTAELADPRVGLVTSALAGVRELTLGAAFENAHLASFAARATAAARRYAGHACVIGKSMLMRRADLAAIGGFSAHADVLAEDYLMGQAMETAGRRVVLAARPLPTVNETWSLGRFANRHLRWAQMRRQISLAAFVFESLLNPIPWLLAAATGTVAGGGGPLAAAALAGVAVKVAADAELVTLLRGHPMRLRALALVPVKDVLVAGLWVLAWFRRTVDWRGNVLRIGPGTRLEAPPPRRRRRRDVGVPA